MEKIMQKRIIIGLIVIIIGLILLINLLERHFPASNIDFDTCLKNQMVDNLADQNIECPNPKISMKDEGYGERTIYLKCKHHYEQSKYLVSGDIIRKCNRLAYGQP